MLQKISTDKAPAAIGPYSQGIVLGNIFSHPDRSLLILLPERFTELPSRNRQSR